PRGIRPGPAPRPVATRPAPRPIGAAFLSKLRTMATRAPNSSRRSGGGSSRSGGKASGSRGGARKSPPSRKPPAKSAPVQGPVAMLFIWLGRALLLVWRLLAHTVGGIARAAGRSARDLDPDLRRDGLGLVLLAAGLLIAAAVWWDTQGPLPEVTRTVVVGAFGTFSPVLPLLFLPFAWRLMRPPGSGRADVGRLFIGSAALLAGLLGLIHIGHGIPWPSDGQEAIQRAGGMIGFAASGPLSSLITPWVTGVLLGMLMVFGLLVVTATPVHRIPERMRQMFGGLMAPDGGPSSGLGILGEEEPAKPKRK